MTSQQIIVALLTTCLVLQQVAAVVNTGQSKSIEESTNNNAESKEVSISNKESDLIADSSEEKLNRREAAVLDDTYNAPALSLPSVQSNLPAPVYGVPDLSSNIYPSSPPLSPSTNLFGPGYGLPSNTYGVPNTYDVPPVKFNLPHRPPKPVYGPPRFQYGPPGKPLGTKFYKNFPSKPYRPIKPFNTYGPPLSYKDTFSHSKLNVNNLSQNINHLGSSNAIGSFPSLYSGAPLSLQYGVPNKNYNAFDTTSQYIPALPQYGPPPQYVATSNVQGVSDQYGVPENAIIGAPTIQYGPPQPSPNPKPPHPGAPAPPTPPNIKYDGWQPIPGLISKPNSNYGAPAVEQHVDVKYENDLVPPPLFNTEGEHKGTLNTYGVPPAQYTDLKPQQPLSDSYGAPLNTVTGSGGIVASSGDEVHGESHHDNNIGLGLSALGIQNQENDIQAVKSVAYQISSNGQGYKQLDSYGVPPVNYFSNNGPYAAAHSYNKLGSFNSAGSFNVHTVHSSHNNYNKYQNNNQFSSANLGLVPPSGVYGLPNGGNHGTSLFGNSFDIQFSKRPIFNKEPEIIKQSAYKEGHGSQSFSHLGSGPVYLQPSFESDVHNQIKESNVPKLSNLYSLPQVHTPKSFQSISLGSSAQDIELFNKPVLTSYNAPLGTVDGSYGPLTKSVTSVGIDFSHPPVSIDLTGGVQQNEFATADCAHKANSVSLPSQSYGVPQNQLVVPQATYGSPDAASLPVPQAQYGAPDLIQSSSFKSESTVNSISEQFDTHGKSYGKSVAENLGSNSELIDSQSLDLNNIPLQGALGSYTLDIQSADGKTNHVPHRQVLDDGLLQSILAAIEKPKSNENSNLRSSIIQLQPSVEKNSLSTNDTTIVLNELGNIRSDTHVASSNINEVIVDAPFKKSENDLQLIDNNGIALYFSNGGNKQTNSTNDMETTTGVTAQSL